MSTALPGSAPCHPAANTSGLCDIVALSTAMKRVMDCVLRAAGTPGGVLLRGEPGSGRRRVARAIHELGGAREAMFVEFDCATSAGGDAEARLFGATERPAESERRRGRECITRDSPLCESVGGTLLLLNVGQMPQGAQDRLLHVLRDREVAIVGGGRLRGVIRLMASIDPSTPWSGKSQPVRADLWRRLATTCIDVPALRDRRADIAALAQVFLDEACQQAGVPMKTLCDPALSLLLSLPYPGNARELRALMERIERGTRGTDVRLEDVVRGLCVEGAVVRGHVEPLRDARLRFEEQYIREVLAYHQGRVSDAARTLGVLRTNLYRRMRALGVSPAARKP